MAIKQDSHIFTGLRRDIDIHRQKPEHLWDARNIRLTTREGDNLLAITTERGPRELALNITGVCVGSASIDGNIILFVHGTTDRIYKIDPEEEEMEKLFEGNLGFSETNHLETLAVYENSEIQKVYFTDGDNPPRVINICNVKYPLGDILDGDPDGDTQFDFVPTLKLKEEIEIETVYGEGLFTPGVIQYAFSYYNKYGRQSNIFYTSPLNYISYKNRGAAPDSSSIPNSFKITISGIDKQFDYLRIYSIHRTSLDAVPAVKRVFDININDLGSATSTVFIDDGRKGNSMDPTELLYIGGEDITVGTFDHKDNTLFMGDYTLKRDSIDTEGLLFSKSVGPNVNVNTNVETAGSNFYLYVQDLSKVCTPGFKTGEHYRLGYQFQHKSGKWSEPIFLEDKTLPTAESIICNRGDITDTAHVKITLEATLNFSPSKLGELIADGYKKIRPICVFPNIHDRLVLAQGMVCPTVYNTEKRNKEELYCQSSWFIRPNLPYNPEKTINTGEGSTTTLNSLGNWAEFRHSHGIAPNSEIQSDDQNVGFVVDSSVVTLHSPDVEFDTAFHFVEDRQYNFTIIGFSYIEGAASKTIVQTSTPGILTDARAESKDPLMQTIYPILDSTDNIKAAFYDNARIKWVDGIVAKKLTGDSDWNQTHFSWYEAGHVKVDNQSHRDRKEIGKFYVDWNVYTWHSSGSLNNDVPRNADKGTRTAVLLKKVISNIKYFGKINSLNGSSISYSLYDYKLFDSDQIGIIKFKRNNKVLNYEANIDQMYLFRNMHYHIGNKQLISYHDRENVDLGVTDDAGNYYSDAAYSETEFPDNTPVVKRGTVRMKYKSTPHLVLSLNSADIGNNVSIGTLPVFTYKNNGEGDISSHTDGFIPVDFVAIYPASYGGQVFSHNGELASKLYEASYQNYDKLVAVFTGVVFDNGNITNLSNTCWIYKIGVAEGQAFLSEHLGVDYIKVQITSNGTTYCLTSTTADNVTTYDWAKYTGTTPVNPTSNRVDQGNLHYHRFKRSTVNIAKAYTTSGSAFNPGTLVNYSGTLAAKGYCFIGEVRRTANAATDFGGDPTDIEVLKSNLWLPAGEPVDITDIPEDATDEEHPVINVTINYTEGDTWYQRYDFLKTYPFTEEDENQVVEIGSFMCESRVNLYGIYSKSKGLADNTYVRPMNFNLINQVYSQKNNFFNYRRYDEDYYKINKFENSITWSKTKIMGADVDAWTNITMANTLDVDGKFGKLNAIRVFTDKILCFQDKGISQLMFNSRVQVPTGDGVPIEITNSYKVDGLVYVSQDNGCHNKWAIIVTDEGVFYIDTDSKQLYKMGGQQGGNLSQAAGMNYYFTTLDSSIWDTSKGLRLFYDNKFKDVYISNNSEALVYSGGLAQFESFMDYENILGMYTIGGKTYYICKSGNKVSIRELNAGDYNMKPSYFEYICCEDPAIEKIFTNVEIRGELYNEDDEEVYNAFMTRIGAKTHYQKDTISDYFYENLVYSKYLPSNLKRKFRIWRMDIPRPNIADRLRGLYSHIKVELDDNENNHFKIHDVVTTFSE